MNFAEHFLAEVQEVARSLDPATVERMTSLLARIREDGGRLFILGVGGSAANASHAVNDFRKITGIEAYAPTDNVSELTARTNDEGWPTVFESWLRTSRLQARDGVLVFSVGGGNLEKNISPNLVAALDYAKSKNAKILGIVGRDGGHTAKVADACVLIPTVNPDHITPHAEAFQAIVWHLLVSHPTLKIAETRWESVPAPAKRRAVFLDRDGVLTRAMIAGGKPLSPAASDELELAGDAKQALARLKAEGFLLLVVTNQPDVARGTLSADTVEQMHGWLRSQLPVDDIFTCYHDDADQCGCRKPLPGLLLQAGNRYNIDTTASYMIGDRWRDVDAGTAAGVKAILIDRGYAERKPSSLPSVRVASLSEAVDWILADSRNSNYEVDSRFNSQAVC